MNRCLTLIDRVRSYSVDDSVTRILPNIVTLTAINIFQESLGYYSVCDVVFAAKILSQKTHRWHVSAYKHKVKSAGAAWNMLLLQQILQTGLSDSGNTDSPLRNQGMILDQVKCIFHEILAHHLFYFWGACMSLGCSEAQNTLRKCSAIFCVCSEDIVETQLRFPYDRSCE